MKLYEIANEYAFLHEYLAGPKEGEGTYEFESRLAEVKDALEVKAENIGKFILSVTAEAAAIKTEEDRLRARRQGLEHKADWLKGYIQQQMEKVGLERIKRDIFTIAIRKNPPAVKITNADAVPAEFWRVIPEQREVARNVILDHFKETGELIPGVEIEQKRRLDIR